MPAQQTKQQHAPARGAMLDGVSLDLSPFLPFPFSFFLVSFLFLYSISFPFPCRYFVAVVVVAIVELV